MAIPDRKAADSKKPIPLEFEQPLAVLQQQLDAVEKQLEDHPELAADFLRLQNQYTELRRSLS